jgi:hypothetical protein
MASAQRVDSADSQEDGEQWPIIPSFRLVFLTHDSSLLTPSIPLAQVTPSFHPRPSVRWRLRLGHFAKFGKLARPIQTKKTA